MSEALLPIEPDEIERDEGWHITDDQQAEWALQKIKSTEAELARWVDYYTAQIARIRASSENTIAFMTARLAEYFQTVPHKETKTQSKYSLPSGDLILKKASRRWEHDDAVLLAWCRDNGIDECVQHTYKVKWADLKKRLTEMEDGTICDKETGLICEGVTAVDTEPEFTAKTT